MRELLAGLLIAALPLAWSWGEERFAYHPLFLLAFLLGGLAVVRLAYWIVGERPPCR